MPAAGHSAIEIPGQRISAAKRILRVVAATFALWRRYVFRPRVRFVGPRRFYVVAKLKTETTELVLRAMLVSTFGTHA